MGHYLTNLARKAAGTPVVRPRRRSVGAEMENEPVQEVLEERIAEQPDPVLAPHLTSSPARPLQVNPDARPRQQEKPEGRGAPGAGRARPIHEEAASAFIDARVHEQRELPETHTDETTRSAAVAGSSTQILSEAAEETATSNGRPQVGTAPSSGAGEEHLTERGSVARNLPQTEIRPPSLKAEHLLSEGPERTSSRRSDAAESTAGTPPPASPVRPTPVVRLTESRTESVEDADATDFAAMGRPSARSAEPETVRPRQQDHNSTSVRERTADPERTVEISIGRIEIRAATPAAQKRGAPAPSSRSSLEVYLEKVRRGGRT